MPLATRVPEGTLLVEQFVIPSDVTSGDGPCPSREFTSPVYPIP